ncbi:MAG: DNA/RNA non-specific endonuclease [Alphaproteobacteria bacterium]|uniref:DNA/RNA non-specific endonuclease n=1 Tax=Marinobacter salarius TaxID=1420917 RepID=UPI0032EE8B7F
MTKHLRRWTRSTSIWVSVVAAGLLVLASVSQAQEIHTPHCLYGCPAGTPSTNDLIVREIYTLSSNDLTKFADWVAYVVTPETIGPSQSRIWRADPLLDPDETLEPEDYTGAHAALGTDRGHQVPLASVSGTPDWETSNYLSNITPQRSDLNQGPWSQLEQAVRDMVTATGNSAYVLTGPLYERPMTPLPGADEPHLVPSGYWKIIAVKDGDQVAVAAFIFEQETPRSAGYCDGLTTVSDIEARSRLMMFSDIGSDPVAIDGGSAVELAQALGCI